MYNYCWNGDKLTAQTWKRNLLYFYYDNDGKPIGFDYNDEHYYYLTNLQGDIIAIIDHGITVAEYKYDAWGNCTILYDTNDIADINPLRYRGYYYDYDTGLYYLQSRYYDANIGRFINADDVEVLLNGEHQLFNYCSNNPIVFTDSDGYFKVRYTDNNKLIKGIGLKLSTKAKAIYKPYQCLNIIKQYHQWIVACANEFLMPPEMIMAILYRELTCYGYDDVVADGMVISYYKGSIFGKLHKKKDSSTGIAQIFAATAINAEKKLGYNTTRNLWTMWQLLNNDYNSIMYCGMVLRMEALNLGLGKKTKISTKDYGFITKVFARYNGSTNYGKIVLNIYKQFLKG